MTLSRSLLQTTALAFTIAVGALGNMPTAHADDKITIMVGGYEKHIYLPAKLAEALGSATASIIFSRSLGNTLGATALGAILNLGIMHFGSGDLAAKLHDVLNQPAGLAGLATTPAIRSVFHSALHWTFWGVFFVAILTFATTWLIPVSREAGRKSPKAGQETI
jgi:hypothetical protein